ncbi:MAG: sugar transferase [Alphaproteobacteria bacterium]|nr:sugar transferase [Alphaproteobacteria bacterium]MCB9697333.1 sugar transferase [Alphaproteobacteria bacterium]
MRQRGPARWMKRALDVAAAGGGLIAAAPVLAGAGAAIWWTMGRPILFRQERVGESERIFRIVKFRTMKNGSGTDEERLTRLGRFLRASSIDELPQLWNVLRGDMSMVGPRPLLVRYLPRYDEDQRRRHHVLPGLTGWAQIGGRNTISWDEKFARDVWYVDHWTPLLDLRILARTALTVVRRDGISAEGHATMPEFMGREAKAGQ